MDRSRAKKNAQVGGFGVETRRFARTERKNWPKHTLKQAQDGLGGVGKDQKYEFLKLPILVPHLPHFTTPFTRF